MPQLTVKPAQKGVPVVKDPSILAGTKESDALIVNQATEVGAKMQETLRSNNNTGDEDNEDGKGKDGGGEDNGDGIDDENGVAMDVDASGLVVDTSFLELLHLKEVLQRASKEVVKIIEDVELVPTKENAAA
ncbi:hypothetical protein C0995_013934 [Termitomyces sp. Mi166|nr:hypothetical protein C0995_013934 [Termitomyces sp. Mi166\